MKWKFYCAVVSVLALGIGIGFLISHHLMMHQIRRFHIRGPVVFVPEILRRLEMGLELREDQKQKIEEILQETTREIAQFHEKTVHPGVDSIFKNGLEKIREQLNDLQKQELEQIKNPFMPSAPNHPFHPPAGMHPPHHGAHHPPRHPPHHRDHPPHGFHPQSKEPPINDN